MDHDLVVLGIGNPGPEYHETRHNAGFMVLDHLAARTGVTFSRLERKAPDGAKRFSGKVKAHVAVLDVPVPAVDPAASGAPASPVGGEAASRGFRRVLLVKPLTYVNLSGDVAGPLLRIAGLPPEALFVVVDDLNLPLGRIRVRPAGSSGGHNGLKSIEQALATPGYPRLRLGIGKLAVAEPGPSAARGVSAGMGDADQVDFVLARFLPEEREVLPSVIERCADVVLEWARGAAVEDLMGRHNSFQASAADGSARGENES